MDAVTRGIARVQDVHDDDTAIEASHIGHLSEYVRRFRRCVQDGRIDTQELKWLEAGWGAVVETAHASYEHNRVEAAMLEQVKGRAREVMA